MYLDNMKYQPPKCRFSEVFKHSALLGIMDTLLKLSDFISGLADVVIFWWGRVVPLCFLLTLSASHWIPQSQGLLLVEL